MAEWKKIVVSGSRAELQQLNVGANQQISSSAADTFLSGSFSGSFYGDGSNLTGLAAIMNLSGSNTSGSFNLGSASLSILGSQNQLDTVYSTASVSQSLLTINLADNVEISSSLTILSGSVIAMSGSISGSNGYFTDLVVSQSFSGSGAYFNDKIVVSSSIVNDLTASFAINAESTALNSGMSQEFSSSNQWIVTHNLHTEYPLVEIWESGSKRVIQPDEITSLNYNTIQIDFTTPVAGWVNVSRAGHVVSGSTLWTNLIGPAQVTASLEISGSLKVTGSGAGDSFVDFTGVDAISGSIFSGSAFSGSFYGDGSNLTGLGGNLVLTSSAGTASLNLLSQSLEFLGTSNQISASIVEDLTGSGSAQLVLALTNDVAITGSLTVGGDLIVNGTTTTIDTENLIIEDQFALFSSASENGERDGGIIISQDATGSQSGYALGIDASADRWALQHSASATGSSLTPDSYLVSVETTTSASWAHMVASGSDNTGSIYGKTNGTGNLLITETDIFIWA